MIQEKPTPRCIQLRPRLLKHRVIALEKTTPDAEEDFSMINSVGPPSVAEDVAVKRLHQHAHRRQYFGFEGPRIITPKVDDAGLNPLVIPQSKVKVLFSGLTRAPAQKEM
jgi:hypothetical protein